MGEVYLARDTRLQRDVAVKLLPAEFAEGGAEQRSFQRWAWGEGRLQREFWRPRLDYHQNKIRVTTTCEEGQVLVEIRDTGVGIPPEHLPRLFDPFFTTKPTGVGTGMGLSVCHGIVTAQGGRISVESHPNQGSTFRVVLPAIETPLEHFGIDEPERAAS